LEAQTSYVTQTVLEPTVGYVRRSYYDPLSCCYRSYLQPTTQYVQRAYQVPVTNHVQRCSVEPVTTCTTPTTVTASYWSPDGVFYYPVLAPAVVTSPSCPVRSANGVAPSANGSTGERESDYPSPDSKKSDYAPQPTPMPAGRNDGTWRQPKGTRAAPAANRAVMPVGRVAISEPGRPLNFSN
jgi:hypothetical protein